MENKVYRTDEFAEELMKLDPRISVVPNPNRDKLSNIKIDGTDVCPIPRYEIKENRDNGYCLELPNGTLVPHKSRTEALQMVNNILETIKTQDGADLFFGRGEYK